MSKLKVWVLCVISAVVGGLGVAQTLVWGWHVRPILEAIYFLSGPGVLVAAFLAYKQIKLTKALAERSEDREKLKTTIELCTEFGNSVIKKINDLDNEVRRLGLQQLWNAPFDKNTGFFRGTPEFIKTAASGCLALTSPFIEAHNAFGTFAMPLILNIADERVAFDLVGPSVLDFCGRYEAMIRFSGSDDDGDDDKIMRLIEKWRARQATGSLKKQKEAIKRKLTAMGA